MSAGLPAPPRPSGEPLLEAQSVKKYFPVKKGLVLGRDLAQVHAVDDVSLEVFAGEALGVVGESGCGKSTLARCLIRLHTLTAGRVLVEGRDISTLSRRQLRPLRREMQMIFQDPYSSLNPRKRVETIIADPLRIHHFGSGARDPTPGTGAARARRPEPGALESLPARVLGRPAPAHRRRAARSRSIRS